MFNEVNTLSSMLSAGRRAGTREFLIKIRVEDLEFASGFFWFWGGFFFGAKHATSYPLFPICGNAFDILQAY